MAPIISLIAALVVITIAELALPLRQPRHAYTTAPIHPAEDDMDTTIWAPGWPHDAPDEPLTVTGALMAMKLHAGCPNRCARKTAAAQALRDAHVSPSLGVR